MTKELSSPRLRFKKDDGSDFPAWEQRKLIDEIELFGGLTYSPKDVVPSPGSLVLRSSNVKDGEISLEDSVYVLKGKATSTPVQLNDIIVVVRNGSRSLIGKHAIVKTPLDNAVIGAFMTGIRTKQPDFISVLMDSQAFKKAITENLGATINQITGGMLKQMVFLMPTSETEKTAIGNFFRTLDDAISLHQKKLEHFKKLKESLLQNMFPREGEIFPRLRFPEFADAWEQCKFGELVKRISGSALSSPENPGVEYDDINSGEGTLNKDVRLKVGTKKGQPFEPADLLYGKLRPYLKNILLPDFSGVAIGDFWVLRPAKYSSKFLFNLIQTPRFEEKANCSAGSKMPRADWKLVSNSIFAVPKDPREAERIGELFLSLNSTITLHQRKLEKMQLLKKALLQQMFI
ncbi:restriction endonuclease subunit S [Turicimonas muris]|uniref:restriction endonuclease subunit S n=1 Tax=Turicimonas muris TaxID=1796652 RepID=UPI0032B22FCA